ncbi:tripartite tricarboxylate transporter TctB family protein [Caenispirillum salinarum]|uniref:tripartite tricarboxylate transporter TctB family protein n=1 Tax=Caenispirillum salinarum TaxID=859058 RepID=UPI00384DF8C9
MTLSRDAVAALCFLALSVAYGWHAGSIQLFPGQEFEPFTPRTFPYALAVIGIVLSLAQLFTVMRKPKAGEKHGKPESWAGFDWGRVAALVVAMVAYGAAFKPLGFIIATSLFLAAGYLILGERRWTVVLGASVPVAVVFWALMTQVLGLYLDPGALIRALTS